MRAGTIVRVQPTAAAIRRPLKLDAICHHKVYVAMKFTAVICTLLCVAPSVSECDELFRCGSSLVSTELSVAELLRKCGEPTSREVSTQDVRTHVVGGGTEKLGTTTTEIWHYGRGSAAAAMVVTIVDGKIQSIERATDK